MEGGGVPHLTWLLLPDAFQLDGSRRVWGMEKARVCWWLCETEQHSPMVKIILMLSLLLEKRALYSFVRWLACLHLNSVLPEDWNYFSLVVRQEGLKLSRVICFSCFLWRTISVSSYQVAHLKWASLNTIGIEKNLFYKGLPAYLSQLEFIKIAVHKPYV